MPRNPFKRVDTSMDIYASPMKGSGRGGRHKRNPGDCTTTWGTCDVRSDDPYRPVGESKTLPHVCAEPGLGNHRHICVACGTPQS